MIKLSVNVNKVATLRNSRGGAAPRVLDAVRVCVDTGAPGITVHPRADRRHITPTDVREIAAQLESASRPVEYNLEGDPREDFLALVAEVRPTQCTLVPVKPGEITSQAGWSPDASVSALASVVTGVKKLGVRVSMFVDPEEAKYPDDKAVAYLLGTALLHQGQDERGALMIQRILKNGDTAEAHMLMAFTRMKVNDKKGAMEDVDRALALNPNLPEAYILRGRLEFLATDLHDSELAFRKGLELDPNAFDALLWLGTLLREQGQLPEARSRLEHALQLQPKEIRARYQFALVCSAQGDDKKAAELLEILIKDAPEYTEAHRSLSTIYFRLGRPNEGREQRKIAETMDAAIQAQDQERGRNLNK